MINFIYPQVYQAVLGNLEFSPCASDLESCMLGSFIETRKISLNTSVYSVSLLPHGHTFHHFWFTHTDSIYTLKLPTLIRTLPLPL